MNRRLWLILVAASAATIALWLWAVRGNPEPVTQGRRVSAWLAELASGTNRIAATAAIKAVGTNCLPFYVECLSERDSRLKLWWVRLVRQHRLPVRCKLAAARRAEGLEAFQILGPNAGPARPLLVRLLDEPECALAAMTALICIGPEASPDLEEGLRHTNIIVRAMAARAFGSMGAHRPETVRLLVNCLGDTDPNVRAAAAQSLGRIRPPEEVVIPRLMLALADPDLDTRSYAAEALGNFRARVARPALEMALHDPTPSFKAIVRTALEKIDAGIR